MPHEAATGDRWPTENPSVTYRDAHFCCDRDGVLVVASDVPEGMSPIAEAPWLRLMTAAGRPALRAPDGRGWIVPGVPGAGGDSTEALAAVWAFRVRLIAAFERPLTSPRDAP